MCSKLVNMSLVLQSENWYFCHFTLSFGSNGWVLRRRMMYLNRFHDLETKFRRVLMLEKIGAKVHFKVASRRSKADDDPLCRLYDVLSRGVIHFVRLFFVLPELHPVPALLELAIRKRWMQPAYELIEESGPSHLKSFRYKV
jgi:hypothetical protein